MGTHIGPVLDAGSRKGPARVPRPATELADTNKYLTSSAGYWDRFFNIFLGVPIMAIDRLITIRDAMSGPD